MGNGRGQHADATNATATTLTLQSVSWFATVRKQNLIAMCGFFPVWLGGLHRREWNLDDMHGAEHLQHGPDTLFCDGIDLGGLNGSAD